MARTIGATNKPKFISIKLKDLNTIFLPETEILVSKEYEFLLNAKSGPVSQSAASQESVESKVKAEIKVIDFN
jgi:hypothetical protein